MAGRADPVEAGLGDFGEHLLPALIERGKVFAYPLPGYWRDLGRPETYVAAHRELLSEDLRLLDDPDWPIIPNGVPQSPARLHAGTQVSNSLVSAGCDNRGTVVDSVLGSGVGVAAGATVADSIVFAGVTIEADATLDWVVVDTATVIRARAQVGEANPGKQTTEEFLTIVGRDCVVGEGVRIARGARLEPGTTA